MNKKEGYLVIAILFGFFLIALINPSITGYSVLNETVCNQEDIVCDGEVYNDDWFWNLENLTGERQFGLETENDYENCSEISYLKICFEEKEIGKKTDKCGGKLIAIQGEDLEFVLDKEDIANIDIEDLEEKVYYEEKGNIIQFWNKECKEIGQGKSKKGKKEKIKKYVRIYKNGELIGEKKYKDEVSYEIVDGNDKIIVDEFIRYYYLGEIDGQFEFLSSKINVVEKDDEWIKTGEVIDEVYEEESSPASSEGSGPSGGGGKSWSSIVKSVVSSVKKKLGITSIVKSSSCKEDWRCNAWTHCIKSKMKRTCVDVNKCGNTFDKPAEEEFCLIAKREQPYVYKEDKGYNWFKWVFYILLLGVIVSWFVLKRAEKQKEKERWR